MDWEMGDPRFESRNEPEPDFRRRELVEEEDLTGLEEDEDLDEDEELDEDELDEDEEDADAELEGVFESRNADR
jgi:hypothetical protein